MGVVAKLLVEGWLAAQPCNFDGFVVIGTGMKGVEAAPLQPATSCDGGGLQHEAGSAKAIFDNSSRIIGRRVAVGVFMQLVWEDMPVKECWACPIPMPHKETQLVAFNRRR
jgi:hypothetical protein